MADVSVKMGVSGVQQFKQSMNDAQASVKTLDAALKQNEKVLKSTGDAEKFMEAQTTLLNRKLQEQKNIATNAEKALKQMESNGVKTTSKAYQDMQRRLIEAQTAMMDTEAEINNLGTASVDAADKTDKLQTSLGGLNKKLSLDQVISGIGSITGAMEKAGQAAVNLGKQIWENITDSARWADDAATQAMILNMDVEDYQKYKKVFDTVGEITVQEWQKAKQKVQKALLNPTNDQVDVMKALGISDVTTVKEGDTVRIAVRNWEDVFWDIGETLQRKVASGEMTQDLADTYANAIFGRSFAGLNPMFKLGKTGFEEALEQQNVVTEESVNKLASLNDQLIKLEGDFDTLKSEVLAGLAPALEGAAKALDGLLGKLLEYLQSEDGQKALEDMGKAVEGLFSDLGKIDPETVVEGFTKVFNSLVESIKWIANNWEGVKKGIEGILGAFLGMKAVSALLTVAKLIDGMKTLNIIKGGTEAAGAAGATTGGMSIMGAVGALGLTGLTATAPVWISKIVADLIPDTSKIGNAARVQAAEYTGEDLEKVRKWADLQNQLAQVDWINDPAEKIEKITSALAELGDIQDSDLGRKFWEYLVANDIMAGKSEIPTDVLDSMIKQMQGGADGLPLTVDPEVPEDAAKSISEQVGVVPIMAQLYANGMAAAGMAGLLGGGNVKSHANGIWSVPFDGYMSILHKGEQVVPARDVASRNYSSNLYVESMYMNNGQDADGLAAAMAAAQRRTMSGYGS